jgi:hypothetical protein
MKNLTKQELKNICEVNNDMGMGLVVKIENNKTDNFPVITNGRFLIAGIKAIHLLEKFNGMYADKVLSDKENKKGYCLKKNSFMGMTNNFPDWKQVVPTGKRKSAKITKINIELKECLGRVLIGEDKSFAVVNNDYIRMLETIGAYIDNADITLEGGTKSGTHAVLFNFDPGTEIKKSLDFILLMPIRMTPEVIEEINWDLSNILGTSEQIKNEHDEIKKELHDVPDTKEDIEQATSEPIDTIEPDETVKNIAKEIIKYDPIHKKQLSPVKTAFEEEPIEEQIDEETENLNNLKDTIEKCRSEKDITNQSEHKIIDVNDAKKLYHKIKDRKAYTSYHLTHDLIDILLNNKIDMIDQLKSIETDTNNPATYKQTRALQRIVFGMHYDQETFNRLMTTL